MATPTLTEQHEIAFQMVASRLANAIADIVADLTVLVKFGPNEVAAIAAFKLLRLMTGPPALSVKAGPTALDVIEERLSSSLDPASARILERVRDDLRALQSNLPSRLRPSLN